MILGTIYVKVSHFRMQGHSVYRSWRLCSRKAVAQTRGVVAQAAFGTGMQDCVGVGGNSVCRTGGRLLDQQGRFRAILGLLLTEKEFFATVVRHIPHTHGCEVVHSDEVHVHGVGAVGRASGRFQTVVLGRHLAISRCVVALHGLAMNPSTAIGFLRKVGVQQVGEFVVVVVVHTKLVLLVVGGGVES